MLTTEMSAEEASTALGGLGRRRRRGGGAGFGRHNRDNGYRSSAAEKAAKKTTGRSLGCGCSFGNPSGWFGRDERDYRQRGSSSTYEASKESTAKRSKHWSCCWLDRDDGNDRCR